MINHLRTLLLNVDGAKVAGQPELGDKFVPADFRARRLNQALMNVRKLLFGADPDRAMLNYRTWQILQCVDSAGLTSLVSDNRVTYDIRQPQYYSREEFSPNVITYAGSDPNDIVVFGALAPCDVTGKMRREFTVTVSGFDCTVVDHIFNTTRTITPVFSNGISEPISLNDSGLWARVKEFDNRMYTVRCYSRPALSLGQLVNNLRQLGSETWETIFSGPNGDVYRDLWENNPDPATKLGAVGVATASRTESAATEILRPSFEVIDINILQQPAEITFVEYETETTLTVVAEGADTYQWQYSDDGVNWFNVGDREASIDLIGIDPADNG